MLVCAGLLCEEIMKDTPERKQIAKMLQDNRDMRRLHCQEMDCGKRKKLEEKMRANREEIEELRVNGFTL
jgi:hypothetical protein